MVSDFKYQRVKYANIDKPKLMSKIVFTYILKPGLIRLYIYKIYKLWCQK